MPAAFKLPTWEDIPPVEGMPHGCAWKVMGDLFDKDGEREQLGSLNFLTAENTKEAAQEIQTGERVSLDWSLDAIKAHNIGRQSFQQKLVDLKEMGFIAFDEEIHINTQGSSQWDGFLHFAHQESQQYYRGVKHADVGTREVGQTMGINKWVEAGGITGRGVLLDWVGWMEDQGRDLPSPVTPHPIPVAELIEVAKAQGTELRLGDILMVRTGFLRWYEAHWDDLDTLKKCVATRLQYIGVESTEESHKWFWERHFAAVAGDCPAFEVCDSELPFHPYFLAFWGTPIGEYFNLERLAQVARKNKRWSFFLTSNPLNIPAGIASPPNAVAIF